MPAYVRGYVVCEGCKKSANASAYIGQAWDKASFTWTLPEGWQLYEPRGHGYVRVFCSYECNKHSAVMGYPNQTGQALPVGAFDERTIDKIYEMVDVGMNSNADANNVLAAIEAVLIAWRQKGAA
jgi:hypothetical protein